MFWKDLGNQNVIEMWRKSYIAKNIAIVKEIALKKIVFCQLQLCVEFLHL